MRKVCPCCGRSRGQQRPTQLPPYPRVECSRCTAINTRATAEASASGMVNGEGGYTLSVHTFPALDTGIGREAGYENDAALIAAFDAERDTMTPEARADLDRTMAQATHDFVFGTKGPANG